MYGADHELPTSLSIYQWGLVKHIAMLLVPFKQLMREISSHLSTAADMIPSVAALKHLLGKAAETDSGVCTAKSTLLEVVNN